MVVAHFFQSDFLKKSLVKLTAFDVEKSQKASFFAPNNYGQTSHSAPVNTYSDIFESTAILIRIKKIPRPQVSVVKPIHWTPLGILAAEHAS